MRQYISYAKKVTYALSLLLAGIVLFVTLSAFGINKTLLNPSFHKQLFNKNDIYKETYSVIKNSMDDFIDSFKKNNPKDYEQHKDIFTLIEKSVTPEMVSSNLDNIREDAFLFFSGKRMFLPDIYLGNFAKYEPAEAVKATGDNKLSAEAISKIDKINLSAILLYINRNDITDQFILIKLVYFVLNAIPGISLLVLLFFLLISLLASKNITDWLKWINRVFLAAFTLSLISAVGLVIYSRFYLPANIRFVAMSLPIKTESIISYARDCIMNMAFYLFACSGAAVVFYLLIRNLDNRLPRLFPAIARLYEKADGRYIKVRRIAKYSAISLMFIIVVLMFSYKAYAFKEGYESNDFSLVVSKLLNSNKVTQVISAKNDALYALQIKLVEPKSGMSIANTPINISGKSELLKKEFNETVTTDYQGIAKFMLDEGTFRLSFIQSDFPSGYQIPSPFFFDLKTAGTTIITVNVDKVPEIAKQKWGVAEIEVLDKDNNPVPGLQLTTSEHVSAPGDPDVVFTTTNSEGIAVFKLNEGKYSAIFTESYMPKKYEMPSPLDIAIKPNTITRYTIRLVDVPPSAPPQKPANLLPSKNAAAKKRN